MRLISFLLIMLLFVSWSYASENSEKEFQFDPNIIYSDVESINIKLIKGYFSAESIAIDINRCNEDTIVLYRKESKGTLDKYYEEIYKLQNEELIRSQKKDIDSLIYDDTRSDIEKTLIDLGEKFKSRNKLTLNVIEINKDIKVEPVLFYHDNQLHTILRVLIGRKEDLLTIPYVILDKIFYKNNGDRIIFMAVEISPGASSFSQEIELFKLDLCKPGRPESAGQNRHEIEGEALLE